MKIFQSFFLLALSILISYSVSSQTNTSCETITIDTEQTGTSSHDEISKKKVVLLPDPQNPTGFKFTPQGTNTFKASVNPYQICDIKNIIPEYNSQNPYLHDISLPVGSISGEATVSESGSAVYQIPIYTPKGTYGVEPTLTVSYNSNSGDGIMGRGWSITGLSSIYCDNNRYEIDGYNEAIKYDNPMVPNDRYEERFAMDGARLVVVNGNYSDNNSEYRTATESFKQVIYTDNYFVSTSKNGIKNYYGVSENSKLKTSPTTQGHILSWLIEKVEDNNGNYITYEYYDDLLHEKQIKRISYTGNEPNGILPYNEIEFFYATREDSKLCYIGGFPFNQSVVLERIAIKSEGAIIKQYQFNYIYDGETKLNEIIEIGKNGGYLNSTIFEWGAEDNTLSSPTNEVVSNFQTFPEYFHIGDFNGDGIHDFAKQYTTSSTPPTSYGIEVKTGNSDGSFSNCQSNSNTYSDAMYTFYGDFNFNGRDDLQILSTPDDNDYFQLTQLELGYDSNNWETNTTSGNSYPLNQIAVANYYGNEKPSILEYLAINGSSLSSINIKHFDVNNNIISTNVQNPFGSNIFYSFINPMHKNRPFSNIDFDGDGTTDLIGIWTTNGLLVNIYEFNESTENFTLLYSVPTTTIDPISYNSNPEHYIFTDLNGDGKTDLMRYNTSSNNWSLYYSNGQTFVSNGTFTSTLDNSSNYKIYAIDMNGDSKADIVEYKITVNGTITTPIVKISYNYGFNSYNSTSYSISNQGTVVTDLVFGDFNGDSKMDIIFFDSDCNCYKIALLRKEDRNDFITKITDGLQFQNHFTYNPITASADLYSNNTSVQGVLYPVKSGIYVVDQCKQSTGTIEQQLSTTSYQYRNGQFHVNKGFLGFGEVISINNLTGITTTIEKTYNNTYYTLNQTITQMRNTSTNSLISQTIDNYYTRQMSIGKPYHYSELVINQIKNDYLNNTFTTSTNTYYNQTSGDFYANLDVVSVNYNNEVIEATKYALYNSNGSWCISNPTEIISSRKQGTQAYFELIENIIYNTNGKIIQSIKDSYPTQGSKPLTTTFTYDSFGNIITHTLYGNSGPNDMQSRSRTAEYSTNGRYLIKRIDNQGLTEEYTYDNSFGNITSFKNAYENTSASKYNGFGNLIESTSPTGVVTYISQDWSSSMSDENVFFINTTCDGKPTKKTWYDIFGREVMSKSNMYNEIVYTQKKYQPDGLLDSESFPYFEGSNPTNWKEYSYDEYRRPTEVSALGLSTTYTYPYYNTVETQTPDGSLMRKQTNGAGQLITSYESSASSVSYEYHSNGKPSSISANNVTSTFTYDMYGNQTTLQEPNAGTMHYGYNAFGDLTWQLDANGNEFDIYYDNSGRITAQECGNDSQYDINYTYYDNGYQKGLLESEVLSNGHIKDFQYDEYGRIAEISETIDANLYNYNYTYDEYGNQATMTYPSGFSIENEYDSHGYLTGVSNAANSNPIWQMSGTNIINEMGKILNYKLGPNNIETTYTYNSAYLLTQMQTGSIFNYDYYFEQESGNLLGRTDNIHNCEEHFEYDAYNRLTSWWTDGQLAKTATYDLKGNILTKTDVGTYSYDLTRVNAVTGINSNDQTMNSLYSQSVEYNPLQKTSIINEGSQDEFKYELFYGTDNQRKKSLYYENNNLSTTKIYSGLYEKEITSAGIERQFCYIPAGDGIAAVYITEGGTAQASTQMLYVVKDYLGSVMALIDDNQSIEQEHSYDAWGNLRNVQNWSYDNIDISFLVNRGYTGHEMLTSFGLINMNGRMYDPIIGRVLSPDNFVQNSGLAQNYNRYSYCMNNPLKYTDPDGESVILIVGIATAAVIGGYVGGSAANGWEPNLCNWNWNSGKTYAGIGIGMVLGGIGGAGFVAGGEFLASSAFFTHFGGSGIVAAWTLSGFVAGGASFAAIGFTSGYNATGNYEYAKLSAKIGFGIGSGIGTTVGIIKGKHVVYQIDQELLSFYLNDVTEEVTSVFGEDLVNNTNIVVRKKWQINNNIAFTQEGNNGSGEFFFGQEGYDAKMKLSRDMLLKYYNNPSRSIRAIIYEEFKHAKDINSGLYTFLRYNEDEYFAHIYLEYNAMTFLYPRFGYEKMNEDMFKYLKIILNY